MDMNSGIICWLKTLACDHLVIPWAMRRARMLLKPLIIAAGVRVACEVLFYYVPLMNT